MLPASPSSAPPSSGSSAPPAAAPAPSRRWVARALITAFRPLVRAIYRIDVSGLEHVPRTGGMVLTANHLSYVDVVLLCAVNPRLLRVVAWGGFQKYAVFRAIFRIFGCLPVTPQNARASLKEAVHALQGGDAVLIFPEGHISRTGEMAEFEGGFGLIARRAGVPVVPAYLGGLWGSIFSYDQGRFFWKWPRRIPYPVTIRFGPPLAPADASEENLRQAVLALATPPVPTVTTPASPPASPRPPGAPLVDFGEAEFRARPALAVHLGAALVHALRRSAGREVVVDRTGAPAQAMPGAKLLAVSLVLAARIRRTIPERRVGIVLPPGLGGLIANLAVVFAGKTPVNLNFTIGRSALEASIKRAGVRTTLSAEAFRKKLAERLPDLPWSEVVLDVRQEIQSLPALKLGLWWVLARLLPAGLLVRLGGVPRAGGDGEAALLFTSGSSGEPKGVVLTHRNILGNCAQIDACGILPQQETLLANLPIFHSFGFTITLWYALLRGIRIVTLPSPLEVTRSIEAIEEEGITAMVGTPTFFRPFLKRAEPAQLAKLKFAVGGAEKTPPEFHAAWRERFGENYFEGYGLTETTPVVAVNLPFPVPSARGGTILGKRPGSVGRLMSGMAARIVDPDTGADAGFNQQGVLWLRGVNVFPGYLDQPEVSAGALRDGWFVTGDLARIDEDGFIFIEGRLSRFSKIGGEMVPHGTVEGAIATALGLQGQERPVIAVAARPDAAKGEALVLLTTVEVTADDLRAKLGATGLPNLWIPRFIKRVDAIPVLGSGKLDLRRLKELAAE
jgi:acyl-[acyl-carrier-protein]-phospholipid O-acyltransferase/long-chain-fatty-acid--[acyl-carrier-protein] ligase